MAENQWFIRGVDEATKRKIKAYAAANGLSIAEALKAIVAEWEAKK
jgi:hypothetical protein